MIERMIRRMLSRVLPIGLVPDGRTDSKRARPLKPGKDSKPDMKGSNATKDKKPNKRDV